MLPTAAACWRRLMICFGRGECSSRCVSVLSWPSEMIAVRGAIVQLRLDLADCPAPVVALWELLEQERRRAAMALLAELIAQTITGGREEPGGGE
jgi:hypothetical protein